MSGHVLRWFRRHWLTGFGEDHPAWSDLEVHEDAGRLTTAIVEKHVLSFLQDASRTSYRGTTVDAKELIGFLPRRD